MRFPNGYGSVKEMSGKRRRPYAVKKTVGWHVNPKTRKAFQEQIARLWELAEDPYYQIVLMLIYNGCRISEFLDLKKETVPLEEQYFDVIASKTENGLRKVPIADKVLPFYKA